MFRLQKRVRGWVLITFMIVSFIGWFSWMTITTNKKNTVKQSVKMAVSTSVKYWSPRAQRVKVKDGDTGKLYYVPNFDRQSPQSRNIETYTLLELNQNKNVPPLKITMFNIVDMGGDLNIHLKVKYEASFGITKTMDVYSHLYTPHYKKSK